MPAPNQGLRYLAPVAKCFQQRADIALQLTSVIIMAQETNRKCRCLIPHREGFDFAVEPRKLCCPGARPFVVTAGKHIVDL
ncbi:hypothetical protein JJB09_07545 [Rhizobium sp. KVB221]|uniref:Uncharacterized protein n=1 Tax=Rhizobium setariae TaxID=2801340 RepID=A0A936YT06_9HYPH|nr:hypothetical protein [Rhizobium setariae]MBL0371880.1 hypothetical protein [Rhizobium setariae]